MLPRFGATMQGNLCFPVVIEVGSATATGSVVISVSAVVSLGMPSSELMLKGKAVLAPGLLDGGGVGGVSLAAVGASSISANWVPRGGGAQSGDGGGIVGVEQILTGTSVSALPENITNYFS